jgi:hypothetical protein
MALSGGFLFVHMVMHSPTRVMDYDYTQGHYSGLNLANGSVYYVVQACLFFRQKQH